MTFSSSTAKRLAGASLYLIQTKKKTKLTKVMTFGSRTAEGLKGANSLSNPNKKEDKT